MKIRISFLVIVFISITSYNVTEATCAANEFECADGTCIQSVYQCDDSFECSDFSDEENCTVVQPCVEGLQQCSSGECVANINDCPLTSEIQTTIAPSPGQPSGLSTVKLDDHYQLLVCLSKFRTPSFVLYQRAALEAIRRLDEISKQKKAYREVFHQDAVGLRNKLKEYCERLMFYNPSDYGRKAEEVLWRKVFYEIIQLMKHNRKHIRMGSSLEAAFRTHLSSATGYYYHLTENSNEKNGTF
ncbi:EST1B [Mytilus edulis]|uniref:SMG5 n=1 Tax=Mytilus edulis TaxID=6550 RepID=A0A8S3VK23_MYTED|nr:EST1B [Mytilus edulis]